MANLLLRIPTVDNRPHDLHLGDDLRYWHTALYLVLEALAQQKLLPGLETIDSSSILARWRPVLDGSRDGPRLARLRTAMPPICRAGTEAPRSQGIPLPAAEPHQLLMTFLEETTDSLARQWGDSVPITRQHTTGPAQDWLRALLHEDAHVRGSETQLQRFYASYRAWLRNLHVSSDEHFRVAFRLEAPSQSGRRGRQEWTLHFLLQARDDPSLLIPAGQIWSNRKQALSGLERLHNPQEMLLTGLGFTTRLFPPLRRSLEGKRPADATLSGEEAYTFLRETAPLLEESGFGMLVPPWWNRPGSRLGVRLRLSGRHGSGQESVASGLVSLDNLVNFQWELSLGGETLSRKEFETLVALKSPLVQIRGQWVRLDPNQIEAAIRFWEKVDQQGEVNLLDAVQMGLGADEVDGLPVDDVDTEGWFQEWMARFTGQERLELVPPPTSLHATLRPYQQYGYAWLDFQRRWGIGAILADDMGLGKTIQTLAMLLRVNEQAGKLPAPVLLICPTSVVINWAKETARFAPDLALYVHQGPNRLQGDEFVETARSTDIVATSYALIRRDHETLRRLDWFGVVLDEAQNIKNPETKQARAIRSLHAAFRLALTGTPVENRLSELWSIMHFLNPGFLGSRQRFRQEFAIPIERYDKQQATERLRRLVSPFILRRVKSDPSVIQDLPEKQESRVYCTLTEEQATLYEAVVREALAAINDAESMERRGLVFSMLMKLKQICNHPAQFLHQTDVVRGESVRANGGDQDSTAFDGAEKRSGKLIRTVELVEELLAEGDRALIFTQFSEMGHLLRGFLQERFGQLVLFLHGGTPARRRNEMVEQFQEDIEGPRLFVLSLKAGGTGLNLTRANHVFHFDRWWNPAVEDQATDRAFRIGQKNNVQVHKFVCVGTLEEKIDEMIESKKALAQAVIGSGENWLTELSTDELHDIEEAFQAANVSLFPDTDAELETDCSCPDWASPCKHIAATYYILGEQFDEDPFLLFRLRGRDQAQVLAALRAQRQTDEAIAEAPELYQVQAEPAPPLEELVEHFWQMAHPLDHFSTAIEPPATPLPILRRLGLAPFVEENLEERLGPAYTAMSERALAAAYTGPESAGEETKASSENLDMQEEEP